MIIKDGNNFLSFITKMLDSLGYEKIEVQSGKAYDLTAEKDGSKYCFKCQYDMDAIGLKKMEELIVGTENQNFDKVVYVTNSSFISSAKKLGDMRGVLLWDRNTVDRMCIGAKDTIVEDEYEPKSSKKGLVVSLVLIILAALGAGVYYYFFR